MELFTTKDNTVIHYEKYGSGHPLVLIHSAFENLTIFNGIVKQLSRSYEVICIDLRGQGYSDKPMHIDFKDYASDIKELLDALYVSHAFLMGQELGASIAVDFAVRYEKYTDGIVLVNPSILQGELPSERLFKKYADTIRTWNEEKQQKFLDQHTYASSKKANKWLKNYQDTNSIMTPLERNAVTQSFEHDHIASELKEVHVPTLVIVGQHNERITPTDVDAFSHQIPNAQLKTFKDAGLYPMAEETKAFLETVTAFFNVETVMEDEQKRVNS